MLVLYYCPFVYYSYSLGKKPASKNHPILGIDFSAFYKRGIMLSSIKCGSPTLSFRQSKTRKNLPVIPQVENNKTKAQYVS